MPAALWEAGYKMLEAHVCFHVSAWLPVGSTVCWNPEGHMVQWHPGAAPPLESPGSASHATEICCCIKRNLESNAELPRGLSGKESASNAGATDDADSIPR